MRKLRLSSNHSVARLLWALRLQSTARAAGEEVVSVRSKAYGPSHSMLSGVPPHSRVVVETHLHPEDAAVQRSVLALAMPGHAEVQVVDANALLGVRRSTADRRVIFPPVGEDLSTRMEALESTMEEQLSTVANLIVDLVGRRTESQLFAMEVSQNYQAHDLANLVVNSIREELKAALPSAARATTDPEAQLDVRELSERISRTVIETMEAKFPPQTPSTSVPEEAAGTQPGLTVEQLENRVAAYFEKMTDSLKEAIVGSSPVATTSSVDGPGLSEDMREVVIQAIEQAARVQQENIAATLEDVLHEQLPSKATVGDGSSSAVDLSGLQDFIESSLRAATDDLRHSIAAEVKKALGKGKKAMARDDASFPAAGVSAEELAAITDRLDDAIQKTQQLFDTVASVDDAVQYTQKVQQQVSGRVDELKHLMQTLLDDVSSPKAPSDSLSKDIVAAVDTLKNSITNVASSVEIGNERLEQQLVNAAQVISESVLTALDAQTTQAVQSALATVSVQLEAIAKFQSAAVAVAPALPTVEPVAAGPPAPSAEDVAAAVETVLKPRIDLLVETYQQRHDTDLLKLADVTTAKVTAALSEMQSAGPTEMAARLESLRNDIVSTVEREMGRTHEVNLTPIYKYIDSVLTFLKERSDEQETMIHAKVTELTGSISSVIQDASNAQRQAVDDLLASHAQAQKQQAAELLSTVNALPRSLEAVDLQAAKSSGVGDGLSKMDLDAVAEKVSHLPTADDLRTTAQQMEASVRDIVEQAIKRIPPPTLPAATTVEVTPPAVPQLSEADVARVTAERNQELLAAIKGIVPPKDMALVEQLSQIEGLLKAKPAAAPVNTKLEDLVESVSKQLSTFGKGEDAELRESLVGIRMLLEEHTKTLQTLQESSKEPPAQSDCALSSADVTKLRAEVQAKVKSLLNTAGRIGNSVSVSEGVRRLREDLTRLQTLSTPRAGEAAPPAVGSSTEPAAPVIDADTIAAIVRAEMVTLREAIGNEKADGSALQRSIRDEVLAALGKATAPPATAPLKADEVQALIGAHLGRIEAVLTTQGKQWAESAATHSKGMTQTVEAAAQRGAQAGAERAVGAYERRAEEAIAKGMTQHTHSIKSLFEEETAKIIMAAARPSNEAERLVDKVLQALEHEKERVGMLTASLRPPPTVKPVAPPQVTTPVTPTVVTTTVEGSLRPWLLLSPVLVVFSIFVCTYYLLACFLLAFVPVPTPAGTSSNLDPPCPLPYRGRRVADQVL